MIRNLSKFTVNDTVVRFDAPSEGKGAPQLSLHPKSLATVKHREFLLLHDKRFFDAVGGGMIHICGNNTHCIRHFNTIPNLYALEVAFNAMDVFEVAGMLREDIVLLCTGPVEPPLLTPLGRATIERLCKGDLPAKKNMLFHFNDPCDADKCRRIYEGIHVA